LLGLAGAVFTGDLLAVVLRTGFLAVGRLTAGFLTAGFLVAVVCAARDFTAA